MYKRFIFLSLFILISGCATSNSGESLSIFYTEKSANLETHRTTKVWTNYEDMKAQWRAEAINLNTGDSPHL